MQVDTSSLLHAALSEGNELAVRFLLKHGADPNGRSRPAGETLRPFQRLLHMGTTSSELEPQPRGRSSSLVHQSTKHIMAPASGSSTLQRLHNSVRTSRDSNLDIIPSARNYPTPLHVAAATGKASLAELLLAAGAEVDARMEGKYTPLAVAVLSRRLEVARLLLAGGANIEAAGRSGKRPLHFAARARRPDLARLLLEHRADVNARTQHGVTALHIAAEKRLPDTVELLLKSGADANAKTTAGVTPLHCAVVKGDKQIAEMILNHGADVNVIVKKGEIDVTPLLWVTEDERRNITEVLTKYVDKSSLVGFYGRFFKKIWKHFSGIK